MALFGLNWEESKWPSHFCPAVPSFFTSKIGVKLPPEKKVPWHRRGPERSSGSNCHFCQKNAFFGQKMTFFQKVHFIQKWSVTPNTIFECVKNDFLLSNPKLVFFTEFDQPIVILWWPIVTLKLPIVTLRWPNMNYSGLKVTYSSVSYTHLTLPTILLV